MFIKQVDEKTALELAAKGKEVLVMVPGGKDSGWEDMMPDTLEHMLEGCMFFRQEPAMETVEECREAREKQKPEKPIPINYKEYVNKIANAEFLKDSCICPNCKIVLRSGKYCNRCGQKLCWNEMEGMKDE